MKKQMTIEMVTEYPGRDGYYYADLRLPAEDYEIRDALQKSRDTGRKDGYREITILNCELIPELADVRLDSPTLDELNFFAKRLDSLGFEEQLVLQAVIDRIIPENYEGEIISIKDLINTTYGLDEIMIAASVGNDEQLGEFVIENDMHEDVSSVPDNALYLLDKKQIGKLQRENEGGVFVNGFYVVAGEYELPEIYDGRTLPSEEKPSEWFAFRLKVAEAPVNSADETEGSAEWISLPIYKSEANRIAKLHNEGCIEDCVYFDFEASVSQFTSEMFGDNSYEDFIMGYRPTENGFERKAGAFYNFCKKAQDDSENDYFFIIDEINRGNLSKIFGELFMLIENDKRGIGLQLLYSNEKFSVPKNLYIIGMMNTADRSLAMLDYALRRRFAFYRMLPGFETKGFRDYQENLGSLKFDRLIATIQTLNEAVSADESLGEGFCIGHSYFCNLKEATDQTLSEIIEFEIIPLLEEYWFDEPTKVKNWVSNLRSAIN
ncbi:AAA family ATPase [Massiliimalia massiliensis]|uniref:AAA family ATPase n=1 Tax=Massiliimalia massiliensis TaxID=1852384 RepID=UPI0038993BAA